MRPPNDESHKGGLNTKLHLAVDSFGMPVRAIITDGTVADCSKTGELINGIDADYLLAGRGYDTDGVIEKVREAKMEAVILPKRDRRRGIGRFNENIIMQYMKTGIKLRKHF